MTRKEFDAIQAEYEKTGFPGLCDRASAECSPDKLATKYWSQVTKAVARGRASFLASASDEEEIYLFCDMHAPNNALLLHESKAASLVSEEKSGPAAMDSSSGFAKLRSRINGHFGVRFQSTGDAASLNEESIIVMQTLDASPENPIIVDFVQHILDPFTGAGQFDLVERDSIRRVFDGASEGGTPVLTSPTMNWQAYDESKSIQVGRNRGEFFGIVSVDDTDQVTLDRNITLPSSDLILTMDGDRDGDNEEIIATKAGFTDGHTVGGWSRFSRVIESDKIYRVDFTPGDAGDGIFFIICRALYSIEGVQ